MSDYNIEDINMDQMGLEAAALNKETTAMDSYVKMPDKEGFVLLRLLPALKGKWHFCSTRIHRLGEYPNSKTFHCLRQRTKTSKGYLWLNPTNNPKEDCPICQKYADLWKLANNQRSDEQMRTQALARSVKPIERFYWNSIVRQQLNNKTNGMETNVGPKIFSCGKTLQTIIVDSINGNPITGLKRLGNVLHPIEGRDFRLVKKIKKGSSGGFEYPDYAQSSFEDVSILGAEDQIKGWLASMHDLDALRVLLSREQVLAATTEFFNGGSGKAEWEEETPHVAAPPKAPVQTVPKQAAIKSKETKNEIEGLVNLGMDEDLQAALAEIE